MPQYAVRLSIVVVSVLAAGSVHAQGVAPLWEVGFKFGLGRTTLIDKAIEVCEEVREEAAAIIGAGATFNCSGDDSGLGWALGADVSRRVGGTRWDWGARVDYTKVSDITIEHALALGIQSVLTDTLTTGWKLGLAPQIGYRPTERSRAYGGVGLRHFDFETDGRQRFRSGTQERVESFGGTASGWAPRVYGGFEYAVWVARTAALLLYFEGERHWLDDDDNDFHATESELLFGLVYRFRR